MSKFTNNQLNSFDFTNDKLAKNITCNQAPKIFIKPETNDSITDNTIKN